MSMITIAAWLQSLPLPTLMAVGFVNTAIGFSLLYLVECSLVERCARVLVQLGAGRVIDARPVPAAQRRVELRSAFGALLTFSLWTPILYAGWRLGLVSIPLHASVGHVALQCALLLVWSEGHFLVMHRLLHTRVLYARVHAQHHRLVVPSPFSAYAMHPVEGFMLGSVMPLAAFCFPLTAWTLVVFPAVHLAFNAAGHANVTLCAEGGMAARHTLHHQKSGPGVLLHLGFLGAVFDGLRWRRAGGARTASAAPRSAPGSV